MRHPLYDQKSHSAVPRGFRGLPNTGARCAIKSELGKQGKVLPVLHAQRNDDDVKATPPLRQDIDATPKPIDNCDSFGVNSCPSTNTPAATATINLKLWCVRTPRPNVHNATRSNSKNSCLSLPPPVQAPACLTCTQAPAAVAHVVCLAADAVFSSATNHAARPGAGALTAVRLLPLAPAPAGAPCQRPMSP